MKAAEEAFFAEFADREDGGSVNTSDIPEGFSAQSWENIKPAIKADLSSTMTIEQVEERWKVPIEILNALKNEA